MYVFLEYLEINTGQLIKLSIQINYLRCKFKNNPMPKGFKKHIYGFNNSGNYGGFPIKL